MKISIQPKIKGVYNKWSRQIHRKPNQAEEPNKHQNSSPNRKRFPRQQSGWLVPKSRRFIIQYFFFLIVFSLLPLLASSLFWFLEIQFLSPRLKFFIKSFFTYRNVCILFRSVFAGPFSLSFFIAFRIFITTVSCSWTAVLAIWICSASAKFLKIFTTMAALSLSVNSLISALHLRLAL